MREFNDGERVWDSLTERYCTVCEFDDGFYTVSFDNDPDYALRDESELEKI